MRPELRGLYAITPDEADDARLFALATAALAGGCKWLQYRDKIADEAGRQHRAAQLAALCRIHGAGLIVNDDIDLALAVDAAGVHLGRDDGDLAAARARLGQRLLGVSCYADFALAQAAVAAGADYVAFGAVFPSPTKPQAVRAPLELFARAAAELPVPACAIGGIALDNARPVIAAGAALIAVITDLFAAADVRLRAAALQALFEEKP